ncbi:MAG: reverse transcriptase domain-containing protein [Gemmatales bacterium]
MISPLLANLYFRRFVLAWKQFGHERQFQARVVNYADDLVICCRPGNGPAAMAAFRNIITRLGLTVNEPKTRLVQLPQESFDFLGYTVGRFYGKEGRAFIGTRISKKAVIKLKKRIHEETSSRWNWQRPEERVEVLNPILRGWCGGTSAGSGDEGVLNGPPVHRESFPQLADAADSCRGRGHHRFPTTTCRGGALQFRAPRVVKTNAKLMIRMRAGCGKPARPVRGAGGGNGHGQASEAPADERAGNRWA